MTNHLGDLTITDSNICIIEVAAVVGFPFRTTVQTRDSHNAIGSIAAKSLSQGCIIYGSYETKIGDVVVCMPETLRNKIIVAVIKTPSIINGKCMSGIIKNHEAQGVVFDVHIFSGQRIIRGDSGRRRLNADNHLLFHTEAVFGIMSRRSTVFEGIHQREQEIAIVLAIPSPIHMIVAAVVTSVANESMQSIGCRMARIDDRTACKEFVVDDIIPLGTGIGRTHNDLHAG